MDSKQTSPSNFIKQRRNNNIIFCILYFCYGLETVLTTSTLYAYLETLVHTDHINIWYGLIASSYYVVDASSSIVMAPYIDRNRQIRKIIFGSVSLVILGNVLYVIHFSPFFLLAGRIVSGMGGAWKPCAMGETGRSFPRSERSRRIATMLMFMYIAIAVGPGINILFSGVHFHIMSLQITFANVPGIYVSMMFFLIQIVAYFKLQDLPLLYESKEVESLQTNNDVKWKSDETAHHSPSDKENLFDSFDKEELKEFKKFDENGNEMAEAKENETKNEKVQTIWSFLLELCHHIEPTLIVFTAGFNSFQRFMTNMWVPMLILDDLRWSINYNYLFSLGATCILLALLIPVTVKKLKASKIFKIILTVLPLSIISSANILILHIYHKNQQLNISLIVAAAVSFGVSNLAEVLVSSVLSLFLPNSALAKGESLRITATRVGQILATLIGGVTYKLMSVFVSLMVVGVIVIVTIILILRKSFFDPKPAF